MGQPVECAARGPGERRHPAADHHRPRLLSGGEQHVELTNGWRHWSLIDGRSPGAGRTPGHILRRVANETMDSSTIGIPQPRRAATSWRMSSTPNTSRTTAPVSTTTGGRARSATRAATAASASTATTRPGSGSGHPSVRRSSSTSDGDAASALASVARCHRDEHADARRDADQAERSPSTTVSRKRGEGSVNASGRNRCRWKRAKARGLHSSRTPLAARYTPTARPSQRTSVRFNGCRRGSMAAHRARTSATPRGQRQHRRRRDGADSQPSMREEPHGHIRPLLARPIRTVRPRSPGRVSNRMSPCCSLASSISCD